MTKSILRCGLLALVAAAVSGAVDVAGPIAGYVADPTQPILRAISGVPGSYLFSDPLSLPPDVTRVHVAAVRDFALAQRGDAGLGMLYLKGGAVDRVADLPGAIASPDWVVFSPSAVSALLFSAAGGRLQLLTGLPDAPQVALDLQTAGFPEQPLNAAASDDGSLLLISSRHSVYRLPRDGPPQLVLSTGQIVSLAVLRNGADAVLSERTTGSIHVLQNVATAAADRVLVSGMGGIGKVYPGSDERSLIVARPGARLVSSVDLASGEIQNFPSPTMPVELLPLRNRDTFLISARPRQPGGIFLRDGTSSRVLLVPAVAGEDAQ